MTKPSMIHFSIGNPRTVCGRRLEDASRVTLEFDEVTCGQCRRHATAAAASEHRWRSSMDAFKALPQADPEEIID